MEEKIIDLLFDVYNSGVDNTECDLTVKSAEITKLFATKDVNECEHETTEHKDIRFNVCVDCNELLEEV